MCLTELLWKLRWEGGWEKSLWSHRAAWLLGVDPPSFPNVVARCELYQQVAGNKILLSLKIGQIFLISLSHQTDQITPS